MTQKQLNQCIAQLPAGQKFSRAYTAFEGGIRFISVDRQGNEYRYTVPCGELRNIPNSALN